MDYIQFWIPIYREQFKKGDYDTKRAIKEHFFKSTHLTLKQKEELWERIVSV